MLTKEQLEAKLAELNKQRETLIANVNALAGAIQLCEQFLLELNKPAATE